MENTEKDKIDKVNFLINNNDNQLILILTIEIWEKGFFKIFFFIISGLFFDQ